MPRYFSWIALLLITLAGCSRERTWQVVAPADAGFSALMPGKPDLEDSTKPQMDASVRNQSFTVSYNEVAYRIEVMTSEVFGHMIAEDIQDALDHGRDAVFTYAKGEKMTSHPVSFGTQRGIEFSFQFHSMKGMPEGGTYKGRSFLVGDRFYQVNAVIPKRREQTETLNLEKYFDSFRITGKQIP